MPNSIILAWDDANSTHAARHGISVREIMQMVESGQWVMVGDTRGRQDRRRVIGWTAARRPITLIVEWLGSSGAYRPVTCWPASRSEIDLYWLRKR